jgi:hypothetical protein
MDITAIIVVILIIIIFFVTRSFLLSALPLLLLGSRAVTGGDKDDDYYMGEWMKEKDLFVGMEQYKDQIVNGFRNLLKRYNISGQHAYEAKYEYLRSIVYLIILQSLDVYYKIYEKSVWFISPKIKEIAQLYVDAIKSKTIRENPEPFREIFESYYIYIYPLSSEANNTLFKLLTAREAIGYDAGYIYAGYWNDKINQSVPRIVLHVQGKNTAQAAINKLYEILTGPGYVSTCSGAEKITSYMCVSQIHPMFIYKESVDFPFRNEPALQNYVNLYKNDGVMSPYISKTLAGDMSLKNPNFGRTQEGIAAAFSTMVAKYPLLFAGLSQEIQKQMYDEITGDHWWYDEKPSKKKIPLEDVINNISEMRDYKVPLGHLLLYMRWSYLLRKNTGVNFRFNAAHCFLIGGQNAYKEEITLTPTWEYMNKFLIEFNKLLVAPDIYYSVELQCQPDEAVWNHVIANSSTPEKNVLAMHSKFAEEAEMIDSLDGSAIKILTPSAWSIKTQPRIIIRATESVIDKIKEITKDMDFITGYEPVAKKI